MNPATLSSASELDLIIPTYNRSGLLRMCLNSVLLATRPAGLKINVFVVDNNSTDDTKQVVQSYVDRPGSMIKYIFVGRPGKSAALNDALAQTTGDIVGLIDDDELIDLTWFEIVHREFSTTPTLDYIGGPCHGNWETKAPGWMPSTYTGAIGVVQRSHRVPFSAKFNGMLMGGNAAIRRSALEAVLPYPERLGKIGGKIRSGEDEVIYHRLLASGAHGMVVPELIIHHWIPASRLTKRYLRKWVVGRGISVGSQLQERGFSESGLLGIQRYRFKIALVAAAHLLTSVSSKERFTAQLSVLDCCAVLYGRHFYQLKTPMPAPTESVLESTLPA